MSHRCQVKIRLDYETPDEELASCDALATKQIGQVWMCDPHYHTFGVAHNYQSITFACDCKKIPAE